MSPKQKWRSRGLGAARRRRRFRREGGGLVEQGGLTEARGGLEHHHATGAVLQAPDGGGKGLELGGALDERRRSEERVGKGERGHAPTDSVAERLFQSRQTSDEN